MRSDEHRAEQRWERMIGMKLIDADALIAELHETYIPNGDARPVFYRVIEKQPEVGCRDCKHWRDSDGVYRRGVWAQSKCPINIKAVYDGVFCCAMWERKTDETDRC